MLIISLCRGSQLHEKVGVWWVYCARCRNLVAWGNIAPGAGRKKVRVTSRFRGWCASKVR